MVDVAKPATHVRVGRRHDRGIAARAVGEIVRHVGENKRPNWAKLVLS